MNTATITIASTDRKTGVSKAGKPWTKFTIHAADNSRYSTFDAGLAGMAESSTGQTATVTFEATEYGNDLKGLVILGDTPAPAPAPTAKPDGQPDWDRIALQKTRCALWAAAIGAGLGADQARVMVAAAEQDIFHRIPGDDGIPF